MSWVSLFKSATKCIDCMRLIIKLSVLDGFRNSFLSAFNIIFFLFISLSHSLYSLSPFVQLLPKFIKKNVVKLYTTLFHLSIWVCIILNMNYRNVPPMCEILSLASARIICLRNLPKGIHAFRHFGEICKGVPWLGVMMMDSGETQFHSSLCLSPKFLIPSLDLPSGTHFGINVIWCYLSIWRQQPKSM